MNTLCRLFEHKHDFRQVEAVAHPSMVNPQSACPVTAHVFRCKCGLEQRYLTPAGVQQLLWGDALNDVLGLAEV